MKKIITLFTLCTIVILGFSQEKLDSTIIEYFDGFNFSPDQKNIYTYNSNKELLSDYDYYWQSPGWSSPDTSNYIYDTNGNTTSYTSPQSEKYEYTFNSSNQLMSGDVSMWSSLSSSWDLFVQFTVKYDLNNNIDSVIVTQWNGSTFDPFSKISYAYDMNDNLIETSTEEWNGTTLTYFLTDKTVFTYSGTNISTIINSYMNQTSLLYEPQSKRVFTYDSFDNAILEIDSAWNTTINNYEEIQKVEQIYDNSKPMSNIANPFNVDPLQKIFPEEIKHNSKILSSKRFQKNGANWDQSHKTTYHYSVDSANLPNAIQDFASAGYSIYPNPTTGILNINTSDIKGNFEIQLIDILGKTVYTNTFNNNQNTINLTENGLLKGTYFLKINTENDSYYSKVVLR